MDGGHLRLLLALAYAASLATTTSPFRSAPDSASLVAVQTNAGSRGGNRYASSSVYGMASGGVAPWADAVSA